MSVKFTVVAQPYRKAVITEDAYMVVSKPGVPFFVVVVDGHRSGDVSKSCAAQFSTFIAYAMAGEFQKNFDPTKFSELFDIVYDQVETRFPKIGAGAVVSCIAIHEGKLYLAQTGDCRLYVSSSNKQSNSGSVCLTKDHIGENLEEAARIHPLIVSGDFALVSDPCLNGWSYLRLYRRDGFGLADGSLQPTRSFGDHEFRPAITHKPELHVFDLSDYEGEFFALCSDGGNQIVRETFVSRSEWVEPDRSSLEHVAEYARIIEPRFNDDDVTIIFLQVVKD